MSDHVTHDIDYYEVLSDTCKAMGMTIGDSIRAAPDTATALREQVAALTTECEQRRLDMVRQKKSIDALNKERDAILWLKEDHDAAMERVSVLTQELSFANEQLRTTRVQRDDAMDSTMKVRTPILGTPTIEERNESRMDALRFQLAAVTKERDELLDALAREQSHHEDSIAEHKQVIARARKLTGCPEDAYFTQWLVLNKPMEPDPPCPQCHANRCVPCQVQALPDGPAKQNALLLLAAVKTEDFPMPRHTDTEGFNNEVLWLYWPGLSVVFFDDGSSRSGGRLNGGANWLSDILGTLHHHYAERPAPEREEWGSVKRPDEPAGFGWQQGGEDKRGDLD